MPLDFAELQKRKRPTRAACPLCLDPDALDAYERAQAARNEALGASLRDPEDPELQSDLATTAAELDKAKKALRKATVTFHFEALPGQQYEDLLDAHPPTPDQIATARRKGQAVPSYNEATFAPALVAACCVDPKMDEGEVGVIWKDPAWNVNERMELFFSAIEANRSMRVHDLGKE